VGLAPYGSRLCIRHVSDWQTITGSKAEIQLGSWARILHRGNTSRRGTIVCCSDHENVDIIWRMNGTISMEKGEMMIRYLKPRGTSTMKDRTLLFENGPAHARHPCPYPHANLQHRCLLTTPRGFYSESILRLIQPLITARLCRPSYVAEPKSTLGPLSWSKAAAASYSTRANIAASEAPFLFASIVRLQMR
jgi:hypothetical protein